MYLKELEIYDNESLENEFIECNKIISSFL